VNKFRFDYVGISGRPLMYIGNCGTAAFECRAYKRIEVG